MKKNLNANSLFENRTVFHTLRSVERRGVKCFNIHVSGFPETITDYHTYAGFLSLRPLFSAEAQRDFLG